MMQSVTCIKPRVNIFISERKIPIKPKISYVKNGNGKIVSTLEMGSPDYNKNRYKQFTVSTSIIIIIIIIYSLVCLYIYHDVITAIVLSIS